MEKKRSWTVTFWVWTFIIANIVGLLTIPGMTTSYSFLSSGMLAMITVYALICTIAGIVVSINILRLREWARRAILFLIVLGLFEIILFVPLNNRSALNIANDPKMEQLFANQYDNLLPEMREKIQVPKDRFVAQMVKVNAGLVKGVTIFFELLLALYHFILLWFFTKLNIRKQFN